MPWAVLLILAFLAGSIPFGWLIARAKGVDIRAHGSGNIGATNVGRVLGRSWGFLCFFLDALKGAGPVLLAGTNRAILGQPLAAIPAVELWLWLATGALALLGHMFSPWVGFKGGKGVATGFGALVAMWTPLTVPAVVALVVWAVLVKALRIMSVASMAGAVSIPVVVALRAALAEEPESAFSAAIPILIVTASIALLVVWKHRSNIALLLRGQERKLGV